MTENHERAEQARFVFHIYGCNVQIVPNATHAIQIIHQGDGTILRTESCITVSYTHLTLPTKLEV